MINLITKLIGLLLQTINKIFKFKLSEFFVNLSNKNYYSRRLGTNSTNFLRNTRLFFPWRILFLFL